MRWLVLTALVVVTLSILAVPVFILHPFKAATAMGITVAYAVKQYGVVFDLAALAVASYVSSKIWNGVWWRKAILSVAVLVMLAATVLARVNVFERMFRPLPAPRYASIAAVTFVDDDDMVMTVAQGAEAAAYPIRQLAYHHIVEDVVGGVPIVVTY